MIAQLKIQQIELSGVEMKHESLAPGCIGVLLVFETEEAAEAFSPGSDIIPISPKLKVIPSAG